MKFEKGQLVIPQEGCEGQYLKKDTVYIIVGAPYHFNTLNFYIIEEVERTGRFTAKTVEEKYLKLYESPLIRWLENK
jgi:hypothetical protein